MSTKIMSAIKEFTSSRKAFLGHNDQNGRFDMLKQGKHVYS